MAEFHLLRPMWLLALLPLTIIFAMILSGGRNHSSWSSVVDDHLLPHLLVKDAEQGRWRWPLLLGTAWLLAVIALAGPTWQRLPPLQFRPQVPPLVILLDLSRSMETRDLQPSRIAVAKAKLRTLLRRLPQRPLSLVVYASTAHSVMPFTEDRKLIMEVLAVVTPEIMPGQGSRASEALSLAAELVESYRAKQADLLLVTDSMDPQAMYLAPRLTEAGLRLSVWGMGSERGGLVPDAQRGYLITESGAVTSRLQTKALAQLAAQGGGQYLIVSSDDRDVDSLIGSLPSPKPSSAVLIEGDGVGWRDGGPWLVLALLPLALLMFRPGQLLVVFVCANLFSPALEASQWEWLWLNGDQRALGSLERQDYQTASKTFQDPLWRAIALYRSGEYSAAVKIFAEIDSAAAHYNRGNALVRLGAYPQAMDSYSKALRLEPNHRDARHNLRLLRHFVERQADKVADAETGAQTRPESAQESSPEAPALTADELLDPPRKETHRHSLASTPPNPLKAGKMGAGAIHLPGNAQQRSDESSTVGEGLGGDPHASRPEDRIARQGTAEDGASRSGSRETAPGHTLSDKRPIDSGTALEAPGPDPLQPQLEEPVSATNPSTGREQGDAQHARPANDRPLSETPGELPGIDPNTNALNGELSQATGIWLDAIEDNPGDLLKEKFRREKERSDRTEIDLDPW